MSTLSHSLSVGACEAETPWTSHDLEIPSPARKTNAKQIQPPMPTQLDRGSGGTEQHHMDVRKSGLG
jgi:hypothetical protein